MQSSGVKALMLSSLLMRPPFRLIKFIFVLTFMSPQSHLTLSSQSLSFQAVGCRYERQTHWYELLNCTSYIQKFAS